MKLAAIVVALAVVLVPCAPAQRKTTKAAKPGVRQDSMPLSTKSAKVRRLLDEAWVLDSDKGEQKKSIEIMEKVVKTDPKFAMGHEILAQISLDPAEQVREQRSASETKGNASSAEQTVI